MIYSYLTMRHPVVEYTLNKIDDLSIVKAKYGFLSILYFPLHITFSLIRNRGVSFNFQYANYRYFLAVIILILLKKDYSVSLWGSDYYKCDGLRKKIVGFILLNAKKVSIASLSSEQYLKEKFGAINVEVVPFLIPNLEEIAQAVNNDFPLTEGKKRRILCGTNGSSNQQFELIIESLKNAEKELIDSYIIVFHLSYGLTKEIKFLIDDFMKNTNLECEVVYEYLQGTSLVEFRKSIDVLVQIQKTDQLSAAMFEHLVQNKLVITGDWLPYEDLRNIGINYKTVSKGNIVSELSNMLVSLDTLTVDSKLKNNQKYIIDNYGRYSGVKRWSKFMAG
ncbi:hypothetical protein [Vibrio navarrensis]|uniref:hypothetical protein n=1 Tax=Vibrio navarrensis TaxID=29495 RepID=UPI00338ED757